jgi:transposase
MRKPTDRISSDQVTPLTNEEKKRIARLLFVMTKDIKFVRSHLNIKQAICYKWIDDLITKTKLDRDSEIITLKREGFSIKGISDMLGVSESTIGRVLNPNKKNAKRKLNVPKETLDEAKEVARLKEEKMVRLEERNGLPVLFVTLEYMTDGTCPEELKFREGYIQNGMIYWKDKEAKDHFEKYRDPPKATQSGIVYVLRPKIEPKARCDCLTGIYKIGKTSRSNLSKRKRELERPLPFDLEEVLRIEPPYPPALSNPNYMSYSVTKRLRASGSSSMRTT